MREDLHLKVLSDVPFITFCAECWMIYQCWLIEFWGSLKASCGHTSCFCVSENNAVCIETIFFFTFNWIALKYSALYNCYLSRLFSHAFKYIQYVINQDIYEEVFCHLLHSVCEKKRELRQLDHGNVPAHTALSILTEKNNEQPLSSPKLAPYDFFFPLVPSSERSLRGPWIWRCGRHHHDNRAAEESFQVKAESVCMSAPSELKFFIYIQ